MAVLPLRPGTRFDHFHHIVFCPETREAVSVDPYDDEAVRAAVAANGLRLTAVVNTHEHWDHAGRNAAMKADSDVLIMAPLAAAGTILPIDRMLCDGDEIMVGETVRLQVLATPGHTMAHIALRGEEGGIPFLISGDTLFAAGAGNCGYGGHAPTLFDTLTTLAAALAEETIVYPGHDYLARNLRFAAHVEPGNDDVRALASEIADLPPDRLRFTTLAEEGRINPFLRCASPALRARLAELDPMLDPEGDDRTVFLALRAYRDRWAEAA
ncbi:hydroxyacylglutathione hydrolase C-terminal domain-containing protein [Sphingomonas colocasiae]|uniref:MBL fold metallo-hydrolase n=1 Tax=Sphingomonas colocasiae TaxID=1848973 RepID=A0ABS7PV39_9SPHN|nr:hydroxyacylglutathione hydrolase C-terminal domain-containing protein [Sphingomonas colocasiae]MBY8824237.1 MBL fold metallo-hydrolase [Sphingomonas colocasiae]